MHQRNKIGAYSRSCSKKNTILPKPQIPIGMILTQDDAVNEAIIERNTLGRKSFNFLDGVLRNKTSRNSNSNNQYLDQIYNSNVIHITTNSNENWKLKERIQ